MKIESVVGSNLARMREARGWSQAQLGAKLGTYLDQEWTRQAVSAGEKGRRSFTSAELLALALVLEVPVPQLLYRASAAYKTDPETLLPGGHVTVGQYERAVFGDRNAGSHDLGRVRELLETAARLQAKALDMSNELQQASELLGSVERMLNSDYDPGADSLPMRSASLESAEDENELEHRKRRAITSGTGEGNDSEAEDG